MSHKVALSFWCDFDLEEDTHLDTNAVLKDIQLFVTSLNLVALRIDIVAAVVRSYVVDHVDEVV